MASAVSQATTPAPFHKLKWELGQANSYVGGEENYSFSLSLGEAAPKKFEGFIDVAALDEKTEPERFPMLGEQTRHGTIRMDLDRSRVSSASFITGLTGRIDPETSNFIGNITSTGCSRILLKPDQQTKVAALASKYALGTPEQRKIQKAKAQQEAAMETCAVRNGDPSRPIARYNGGADYLRAPAFKGGLFVYRHTCLSKETRKTSLVYSRTQPDAEGDQIEVFSGPFPNGTLISRRDVTIVPLSSVCRVFDYSNVGGRRMFCEPYGWRYTAAVRDKCINNASYGPGGATTALRCQIMVMGRTIEPFERGPRQTALR